MKPKPNLWILCILLQAVAFLIFINQEVYSQKRPKDHIVKWGTEPNEVCPKVSIGAEAGIFVPTEDNLNDVYGVSFTPALSASYYFSKNFSLQIKQGYWGGNYEQSLEMFSSSSKMRAWPLTVSGFYHYPFNDGHFAWYGGAGTGIVFGKSIAEMTTLDPHTYEWVTTTDKESKTGWDVHATTGLQYCITPNLEVNLNLNYAYQPFSDWDFDMGGFAATVGVVYSLDFNKTRAINDQPVDENINDYHVINENDCECDKVKINLDMKNKENANIQIPPVKVKYDNRGMGKKGGIYITVELKFQALIKCEEIVDKKGCHAHLTSTFQWAIGDDEVTPLATTLPTFIIPVAMCNGPELVNSIDGTYVAKFEKSEKNFSATLTITLSSTDCNSNGSQTMIIIVDPTKKEDIDWANSNYDNDAKINIEDKNPYDPNIQ